MTDSNIIDFEVELHTNVNLIPHNHPLKLVKEIPSRTTTHSVVLTSFSIGFPLIEREGFLYRMDNGKQVRSNNRAYKKTIRSLEDIEGLSALEIVYILQDYRRVNEELQGIKDRLEYLIKG